MLKKSELIARRAAIATELQGADLTDDRVDELNTEYRGLARQIERAEIIELSERRESGEVISGDRKLDQEIRARFSVTRAIAAAAGLGVDNGFEREVQAELATRAGKPAEGIYIPTEVFEQRVLTTTAGAELVATQQRPDLYISALVNSSVIRSLGATVLSGLTGNLSIPRETDSPAVGWVAENAALSSDDADFDSVTLSPKHVGALSEWSRNMLLQSSPDVEMLLRNMLARNIALAIDLAAIKGGGTNEPVGVLSTSGIQTQAYASSLFATTAEMIAKADIANVATAKRGFLTTNNVKKLGMKALDGNGLPVGGDKLFHGEPVAFANQVPTNLGGTTNNHGLIYGDWSELLIGIWSEIDLLVNPYESTAYAKGNVSIRAMATVDVAVRHPAAFVTATGVLVGATAFA